MITRIKELLLQINERLQAMIGRVREGLPGVIERVLHACEENPRLKRVVVLVLPDPLDPALPGDEIMGSRRSIRITAFFLGLLLLWSMLFTLDIASHSTGDVISSGQTKLIQHLEGGIVRRILVREGQRVASGEPLAEVERVASEAEMRELESFLGALQIREIRLEAQIAGAEQVKVPADLEARFPEQVQTMRALFASQKNRLGGSNEEQKQKIAQRRAEEAELRARRSHVTGKLKLLRQQIEISDKLLAEGLTNRYEHLNLLKEEELSRGTVREIDASLSRIEAALRQEQAALVALDSGGDEEMQRDLAETRRQIKELQERLRKFTDSQERLVVRSPIDGVVMTLHVVTEGGVIQPGGTLMSLVPANEPLLVEARLPVGDIGMVNVGQPVRLQLMSSVARGFQPIDGEVIEISPDSVLDEQRMPYYRVRIRPNQDAFVHGKVRYTLLPGVPVSVAILTGERTLFGYLAAPLMEGMGKLFTEP